MLSSSTITFSDRVPASLLSVESFAELPSLLHSINLLRPRPTLAIVGGASQISAEDLRRLRYLFTDTLVPIAQQYQAVVVDGGTDAGVMRMIGQARAEAQATFPLVGVCPGEMVCLPNQPASCEDAAPLEPNHTHFFLVPGDRWGAESKWIAQIANTISTRPNAEASVAPLPSLTILINGGEVTWEDARQNVQMGRTLIVISETGRTADIIAAAVRGEVVDARAEAVLKTGHVQVVALSESSGALPPIIEELFGK